MITVNRLNGKPIVINCDLIESIEETPDTIITMTNQRKLMVSESKDEIVEKVIAFRRRINGLNPIERGNY